MFSKMLIRMQKYKDRSFLMSGLYFQLLENLIERKTLLLKELLMIRIIQFGSIWNYN